MKLPTVLEIVPEPLLSKSVNACLHNSSSTALSIKTPLCGREPLFAFIAGHLCNNSFMLFRDFLIIHNNNNFKSFFEENVNENVVTIL